MKIFAIAQRSAHAALLIAVFTALAPFTCAEPPTTPPATPNVPAPVPPTAPAAPAAEPVARIPDDPPLKFNAEPQVRFDVLIVSLAAEKAVALLPALRDAQRFDAAQAQLLEMIGRKEAQLVDWPELSTYSGNRAVTYSILEERRRTEESPEPAPKPGDGVPIRDSFGGKSLFEIRNLGVTVEMLPQVSPDRQQVNVSLGVTVTLRDPRAEPLVGRAPDGQPIVAREPVYTSAKSSTYLGFRDGERRLIYSARQNPEGPMLLFIAGVKILPGR